MPNPRGRPKGFSPGPMTEDHRRKIGQSRILGNLIKFAEGDPEVIMTPAQVTAALGLLKKALPDLTSVELSGSIAVSHEEALKDLE